MAICRAMYLHGKWVEYVSTGSLAYLSTLFCAVFTASAPGFGCVWLVLEGWLSAEKKILFMDLLTATNMV